MRLVLKQGLFALAAVDDLEAAALAGLGQMASGHVFHLKAGGSGISLHDLGAKADACNEPINLHANVKDPQLRLIGNLAHTPFEMDGLRFASVEAFWQGLKFETQSERRRVATLHGVEAKQSGRAVPYKHSLEYCGRTIRVGRPDHWALMRSACEAKFNQHDGARAALLATARRPLTHVVRKDSDTIPGVVMADIWMKIRNGLRND